MRLPTPVLAVMVLAGVLGLAAAVCPNYGALTCTHCHLDAGGTWSPGSAWDPTTPDGSSIACLNDCTSTVNTIVISGAPTATADTHIVGDPACKPGGTGSYRTRVEANGNLDVTSLIVATNGIVSLDQDTSALTAGTIAVNGGTFVLSAASSVANSGGLTASNRGSVELSRNAKKTGSSQWMINDDASLTVSATPVGTTAFQWDGTDPGATQPSIVNQGLLTVNGDLDMIAGSTLSNVGRMDLAADLLGGGAFENSGTFTSTGDRTIALPVTNQAPGGFYVESGTLTLSGSLGVAGGKAGPYRLATLDVGGVVTIADGGVLGGAGVVSATSFEIGTGGIVEPANFEDPDLTIDQVLEIHGPLTSVANGGHILIYVASTKPRHTAVVFDTAPTLDNDILVDSVFYSKFDADKDKLEIPVLTFPSAPTGNGAFLAGSLSKGSPYACVEASQTEGSYTLIYRKHLVDDCIDPNAPEPFTIPPIAYGIVGALAIGGLLAFGIIKLKDREPSDEPGLFSRIKEKMASSKAEDGGEDGEKEAVIRKGSQGRNSQGRRGSQGRGSQGRRGSRGRDGDRRPRQGSAGRQAVKGAQRDHRGHGGRKKKNTRPVVPKKSYKPKDPVERWLQKAQQPSVAIATTDDTLSVNLEDDQ